MKTMNEARGSGEEEYFFDKLWLLLTAFYSSSSRSSGTLHPFFKCMSECAHYKAFLVFTLSERLRFLLK